MNGSRPGSVSRASHLETQSNAYATINKLPMVAQLVQGKQERYKPALLLNVPVSDYIYILYAIVTF